VFALIKSLCSVLCYLIVLPKIYIKKHFCVLAHMNNVFSFTNLIIRTPYVMDDGMVDDN